MFMLKSIFGRVASETNATELAKLPSGQFYLVRPGSIKGARECIFNDAMATVRRTSAEFHYELVITRVFEEGGELLLDEDDETDLERTFLIDQKLQFRSDTYEGNPTFIWRDLEDGAESPEDLFEFVVSGSSDVAIPFEAAVLNAMYERKHLKSSSNATKTDLQALMYKPGKPKNRAIEADGLAAQVANMPISSKSPNSSIKGKGKAVRMPEPEPAPAPETRAVVPASTDGRPLVHSEQAELYLWDKDAESFAKQVDGLVEARIVKNGEFDYWLVVNDDGSPWLAHEITENMNGRWSKQLLTFTWIHVSNNEQSNSYALRFADIGSFSRFLDAYARCHYETINRVGWAKAKADEQEWAVNAYQDPDVEMKDAEEEEEEIEGELEDVSEEEEEEVEAEDEDEERPPQDGAVNSHLTVGNKNDRSFVVRGNKIGVFRHTNDDKIQYAATINKVATPKGKQFSPEKVMLHDQDSSMILMNPNDKHAVYRMDLEYGKVVDEWKIHDDIPISLIAPDSKFAQMTPQKTFIGGSSNAMYRVDPRLSGNKLVDSEFKQYATKTAFSSATTTQQGKIALASNKGDVRLFNALGKNAKTALPALGDPIIGIDVTNDGEWIVATCKTYLLLINTKIGEGKYAGQSGFDRSFPADAKPIPRRLMLRPEHVAYMGGDVTFTPARFNTGIDQVEKTIVTSSGPFVIAWDFAKVKAGRVDKYEMRRYEDKVVADNFKFGNDDNIVVALSNNVLMVNKKALQKPSRKSLAMTTPTRRGKSTTSY